MSDFFTGIKIGTTMDALENFVNTCSTSFSEQAKTSIFNYIEEERKNGDKMISTQGELKLVLDWLKGAIKMPKNMDVMAQNVDPQKEVYENENGDTTTVLTLHKEIDESNSEKEKITTISSDDSEDITFRKYSYIYENSDSKRTETLYDDDNDTIADNRETSYEYPDGTVVKYTDDKADGSYDSKTVIKSGVTVQYEKDENGEWIINKTF